MQKLVEGPLHICGCCVIIHPWDRLCTKRATFLLMTPLATLKTLIAAQFLIASLSLYQHYKCHKPHEWNDCTTIHQTLLADETNIALFSVSLYLTMMWKVKAVHNIQTIKEECYSNPPITTNGSKNVQVFQVWYLFYTTFSYLYLICT